MCGYMQRTSRLGHHKRFGGGRGIGGFGGYLRLVVDVLSGLHPKVTSTMTSPTARSSLQCSPCVDLSATFHHGRHSSHSAGHHRGSLVPIRIVLRLVLLHLCIRRVLSTGTLCSGHNLGHRFGLWMNFGCCLDSNPWVRSAHRVGDWKLPGTPSACGRSLEGLVNDRLSFTLFGVVFRSARSSLSLHLDGNNIRVVARRC